MTRCQFCGCRLSPGRDTCFNCLDLREGDPQDGFFYGEPRPGADQANLAVALRAEATRIARRTAALRAEADRIRKRAA